MQLLHGRVIIMYSIYSRPVDKISVLVFIYNRNVLCGNMQMFIDIKFFKEKVMGGHQAEGMLWDFIILQASQIICFKHFRSYFREKK